MTTCNNDLSSGYCLVGCQNEYALKKEVCYCWNKYTSKKSATEKPDQQEQRLVWMRVGQRAQWQCTLLPHPNLADYLLPCCSLRLAPQSHAFGLVYVTARLLTIDPFVNRSTGL